MTAVTHTWALTIRDLLRLWRQPWFIAVVLVQPVIWLLLFGALFERIVDIPGFQGGDYKQYLVPGVLVMTAFFSSGWNGMSMIEDLDRGVIDRLLVTAVKRLPLIGGRVGQNLVQVTVQSLIIVALALPLVFLSTAFMQPRLMPGWITTVADFNPVNWAIVAGREAVGAATDWATVAGYCGLLALFAACV